MVMIGILVVSDTFQFGFLELDEHSLFEQILLVLGILSIEFIIPIYVHNLFLLKKLIYKKQYLTYGLGVLILIITTVWLQAIYTSHTLTLDIVLRLGTSCFLVIIVGAAFYTTKEALINRALFIEMKEFKSEIELKMLKEQVNPHFLYNTLNNIYYLALTNKEQTAESIIKLSELMRYTTEINKKERVPLQKEVDFIKNYITLQNLRLDQIKLNFDIQIENENHLRIAPLLLIPFVENAFKHGVSSSIKTALVNIELAVKSSVLYFSVLNSIPPKKEDDRVSDNTNEGLKNVKKRLAIIYPERHELVIKKTEDLFHVELKLNLSSNNQ